ncbi:MAG: hypothetical protein WCB92_03955 [Mycobacterium sp.]
MRGRDAAVTVELEPGCNVTSDGRSVGREAGDGTLITMTESGDER